ncbi:hypothetical protein B7P43_G14789 [Paramuricea clavata]|uniref:Uncharacterized protein n=1 Tax=Paramuricea clavata TaxID=317549 RepID=A0A7D9IZS9_PARCT|nr:hypothetical protein B7P43_G14789 [Paramuricea clavata]
MPSNFIISIYEQLVVLVCASVIGDSFTNTLPTNDVKSRFSNGNSPTCRIGHSPDNTETLPHIICHCHPNMPSITKGHNSVLQRLTNAVNCGTYTVDEVVPGAPGINRPDLVITENNKVTIIDVMHPFENDDSALTSAALRKEEKYNYLIDHFGTLNKQAKVFGFVVGLLGGWFPGNERRHYTNCHKGVSLIISAKCSICPKKFPEARGAGVHCKCAHNIGTNDSFPCSPTPVMSYVALDDESNNTTLTPSRKRRRQSSRLLAELDTSMSCPASSPSINSTSCISDTFDIPPPLQPFTPLSQSLTPSLNSIPPQPNFPTVGTASATHIDSIMSQHILPSPRIPHGPNSKSHLPGMINLDPESDPAPPSPPKPSASHPLPDTLPPSNSNSPSAAPSEPIPEAEVSFVGPTNAENCVQHRAPHPMSSNADTSDTAVSLSGDTAEDIFFPPTLPNPPPYPNPESSCQPPPTTNLIPPSNNTSDPIQRFHDKWSVVFSDSDNWPKFSDNCSVPVSNNRHPLRYNPIEARRLQSLYRISKKRAARKVINDNKPPYAGSVEDAENFFTNMFSAKFCDRDGIKRGLNDFVPSGPSDNHLGDHVSPSEVLKKLHSLSNSAPGKDRVEYRHLRTVDPKCEVLVAIFNRCMDENDVPAEWKESVTIFNSQKG